MIEPKVELKNVKMFQGHDGTGLNADIWINGIKCQHVYDGADGGEFEYTTLKTGNVKKDNLIDANVKLLVDYVDQLPEEKTDIIKDGKPMMIKYGLDVYIDRVLEKQEQAKNIKKFQKKMNKHMVTSIVIGVPDSGRYQMVDYRKPLQDINANILQQIVDKIKNKHCTGDIVILNNNLENLGINV